jgi:hypothetical protein
MLVAALVLSTKTRRSGIHLALARTPLSRAGAGAPQAAANSLAHTAAQEE